MKSDEIIFFLMELAPFSIKLGDLIEYHYSYLHRLKSLQTLMLGKSTAIFFVLIMFKKIDQND